MRGKRIHIIILLLAIFQINVFAAPYSSLVPNRYNKWSHCIPLYEPLTTVDVELNNPRDIFIDDNDSLYVLEEKRLIVFGSDNVEKLVLDENDLNKATGLFVDENHIYIADNGDGKVKIFGHDGTVEREIGIPKSKIYGKKSTFLPLKIAVNENQQLFVLSDGNTNGLVQLDIEGKFVGYFGRNNAITNIFQKIKEKVLKDTPLGNLIKVTPPSLHNMDIDKKGVVYVSSVGDLEEKVRRLNVASNNIFSKDPLDQGWYERIEDIAVNQDTVFLLASDTGSIIMSDKHGERIGVFGSKTNNAPVTGLFLSPIAIDIDSSNRVYVLDNSLNNIQIFEPTEFTKTIFEANKHYKAGEYEESKALWKEVLKTSPSNQLASKSMGLIERKAANYDDSLDYFSRANDKAGYSESFWELRRDFTTTYLGIILISLVALYFILLLYEKLLKQTKLMIAIKTKCAKFYHFSFIKDLKLLGKVMRKPNDIFYDIRAKDEVSVRNAGIILVLSLCCVVASKYIYSYLFYSGYKELINTFDIVINILVLLVLYMLSNFLITSIFDGEGKFRHIFIGTIYAFAPFFIFAIPIAVFTNALTLNEIFLVQLCNVMMYLGVVILLLIMNIEVHNYRFNESLKVLILTLFTMLVIVIVGISLYALFNQLITFIYSIIKEVLVRV